MTVDIAFPWVLSNTPAKFEVVKMRGCRENQKSDRLTEIPPFIAR